MIELQDLPASRRVLLGLDDLKEGKTTIDAMLAAVASHRLGELGLEFPPGEDLPRHPELALYKLLSGLSEDPFYAYKAMLDELDSFISSLEALRSSGEVP